MQKEKPLIGIIGGTSQFGQWFKFFFESCGYGCVVAGRKTALTPKELTQKADIVIVSVPIREAVSVIREIRDLLKPSALLCDFTSVKVKPLKEMLKRKQGGVLGIHPLFGHLVPSIKGQNIVFSKGRGNKWVSVLKEIFESKGANIISISAEEHDKQMAMVQAMTHFVNIIFSKVLQRQKVQPQNIFSTPVYRFQSILAGRVLGGNPSLYADIEINNSFFHTMLKQFVKDVSSFAEKVLNGDEAAFEKEFQTIAKSMENFIPIAQTKSTEIMQLLDKQPVEIRKPEIVNLKRGSKSKNVACLGPEGTFSHTASKQMFPNEKNLHFTSTIKQIFRAVESGEVLYGVVPIENSTNGLVYETLDSILDYPLQVIGSYKMEIHHNLLGRTKDISKIKVIKSHIQPLGQCRGWLNDNLPGVILEPQDSSTKAILSTTDESVAFIGSLEAAKEYGLEILANNIEDGKKNVTEFYVISKIADSKISNKLNAGKSLIISAVYDRSGILRDILDIFAKNGLTLTKLHSRASVVEGWDYYFFFEVDCLPETEAFKNATKEVKKLCSVFRVFGVA